MTLHLKGERLAIALILFLALSGFFTQRTKLSLPPTTKQEEIEIGEKTTITTTLTTKSPKATNGRTTNTESLRSLNELGTRSKTTATTTTATTNTTAENMQSLQTKKKTEIGNKMATATTTIATNATTNSVRSSQKKKTAATTAANTTAKDTQSMQRKKKTEIGNKTIKTTTTIATNATTNSAQSAQTKKTPGIENKTTATAIKNDTPFKIWNSYRLGDWVLGGGKASLMKPWFRDTLAWEYASEVDRRSNGKLVKYVNGKILRPAKYVREALCDLVEKRAKGQARAKDLQLPRPGDVVLHLRLGDTLDEMMLLEEAGDVFEHGVSIVPSQIRNMINKGNTLGWWHYVKSKCYYENVLERMNEAEAAKANAAGAQPHKRLIIVGSTIHKKTASNRVSMKYTKLVEQFFIDRGYEVKTRLDGMPDDDMVWMSHAPLFVAAGGGFSRLVSDCVEYLGGISLRPSRSSNGLEESCWSAPKPTFDLKNYSWENAGWHGKKSMWNRIKNYPPEKTIWH